MDLANRVAIISGAASGIGKAISIEFANQAAIVFMLDINPQALEETATQIKQKGQNVYTILCDVSQPEQIKLAVSKVLAQCKSIHILVNNAGISPLTSFEEISIEEWNKVLEVNLTSAFLLSQATLPYLRLAGENGRVINIASLAGISGGITVGAHYAASKAGLIVLGKHLAKLLAPTRGTVNNICPGTTETPLIESWEENIKESLLAQIPLKRFCRTEEIAACAAFLASAKAGYITGATININGGLLIS